MAVPLLSVEDLKTHFPIRRDQIVRAVDDVTFTIKKGEVLGLVGESGSGKSTVGRSMIRLERPTSGKIRFDGTDLTPLGDRAFKPWRRKMQYIFQDPYASLNPRKRVGAILNEALSIHAIGTRRDRPDRIAALLRKVGLDAEAAGRFPHEFSGGQRQRIGIARALAVEPEFIIADEPVSALDVSVQAQVLNLIQDLQTDLNLTMLFIAHDLGVVEHLCDRILVMYLGRIMESGTKRQIYENPQHPYTQALLSSVPQLKPRKTARILLQGDIPSPISPPSGCVFRTRCPIATADCANVVPELRPLGDPQHQAACIRI